MSTPMRIPADSLPAVRTLVLNSALARVVDLVTHTDATYLLTPDHKLSDGEAALLEVAAFVAGQGDRLTGPASSPQLDEPSERAIDEALRSWHRAVGVAA